MNNPNAIQYGVHANVELASLTTSLGDQIKGLFSNFMFLAGAFLGVSLTAVSLLSPGLDVAILGLVISAVATPFLAIYGSAWLSGWSPAWLLVTRHRLGEHIFVVALDRIKRKRVFKFNGCSWSEGNGHESDIDPMALLWLNLVVDQLTQQDA